MHNFNPTFAVTARASGWISQSVGLTLHLKYFVLHPCSEPGISRHPACAVRTPQGLTGTISSSGEKPYKVFLPGLKQIMKRCFICRVIWWWKITLRSSQDWNLGPLNSSQMLLPCNWATGALALEQRIDGHRHRSNLRLNLSICRPYSALLSTEVL